MTRNYCVRHEVSSGLTTPVQWFNICLMDKPTISPFSVYTPKEVARVTGIGQPTIYRAIKSGELVGKEIGNGVKITGENILQYLGSASYQSPSPSTPSTPNTAGVPSASELPESQNR